MAERNIDVRVRLKGADQFKQGMTSVEGSLSGLGLGTSLAGVGIAALHKGIQALTQAVKDSVASSIDFETALAGLQKTAGLSDTAMEQMKQGIMDMSERVPMTSEKIALLADNFAHLGLAKDEILPFTEVMIALGAATDMSAEEAGSALAKLANVMDTDISEFEALGSTVFALGRTSATTESAIVDMASAMSGSAALFGMSEADVLAFAAALSSVGVQSKSGATTIQKLGTQIELMVVNGGDDLEEFAAVAGMTADQFAAAWRADPASVIAAFVTGLGQIDANGGSAIATLNDLGITEVRMSRNLASLAAAGDLVNRSLTTGRTAWEENTELANATSIAYGTTASKMAMAQNAIENAQIAVGDGLKGISLEVKQVEASAARGLRDTIMDKNLPKQLEEINKRYDQTGKAISNARDKAVLLIDTMDGLGDVSELDSTSLEQYEASARALMSVVPGRDRMWNAQTKTWEGGTEAVRAYVEEQYNLANSANEVGRSGEQMEAYSGKVEALLELQEQQALALAELTDAQAEFDALQDQGLGEWEIANSEELRRLEAASRAYNSLTKDVDECSTHLDEYSYIADDAVTASENLGTALEGAGDSAETADGQISDLEKRLQIYSDEAQAIIDDFNESLEEAQKKVEKTFGTSFEYKDPIEKGQPVDKTMEGMESQIEFAERYVELLEKARELGVDDNALAELADGSDDSMMILEGLIADGGESIDEFNAKYAEVNEARNAMAEAMADATSNATQRMAEIEEATNRMVDNADQSARAQAGTSATMQGLIDGIDTKIATLRNKVKQVELLNEKLAGSDGGDGTGHAAGLSYVPFDGYVAQLHRGEMVLTALEAKAYRAEQFANYRMPETVGTTDNRHDFGNLSSTTTISFGDVHVRDQSDIEDLSRKLAKLSKRKSRGVGAIA